MKKKMILILCVCMCILCMAACGTEPEDMDYNGSTYQELESYAISNWEDIYAMDLVQIEGAIVEIEAMSEAEQIQFMEQEEGIKEYYTLAKSWLAVSKEAGAYQGIDSFRVSKSGKNTTTELFLNFEKRPVVLSIVYKNRDMTVESVGVDLVYSTSEKVGKAAMNTLMGMGTVFIMLIIISLCISCFAIIPKIENKIKEKNAKKSDNAIETKNTNVVVERIEETAMDDLELVAVIAAAIAASTGQSTDDFVVRSIKRR